MHRLSIALTVALWTAAACGGPDSTAQPSPSIAPPVATGPVGISPPTKVVATGFPGAEACNNEYLFAGRAVGGRGVNEIWMVPRQGNAPPARLVRLDLPDVPPSAPSQQKVPPTISAVRVAGDWLTFTEYQQQGTSLSMAYWTVAVVHVPDGRLTVVASGSGAALAELPSPSISSDGVVVWDQLGPNGKELHLRDMAASNEQTVPLPSGTYPIFPRIERTSIVFADNQTDLKRSEENWVSRGGRLMMYDLPTGHLRSLASTNDARHPELSNGRILWYATVTDPKGQSSSVWEIRVSRLDGSPPAVLGPVGTNGLISASHALWFDFESGRTYTHSFVSGRDYHLDVVGLGVQTRLPIPSYALCDSTIFYVDASSNQLKSVTAP